MVPRERIELSSSCERWILSPLRLPVPPPRHFKLIALNDTMYKELCRVRQKALSLKLQNLAVRCFLSPLASYPEQGE